MVVGVLQLELTIPDSFSLKDKRRVIHSLKDRLAHGRNISIAEVGDLEHHRRAMLAVVLVANDAAYVQGGLAKIVDFVTAVPQVNLLDYQIDLL